MNMIKRAVCSRQLDENIVSDSCAQERKFKTMYSQLGDFRNVFMKTSFTAISQPI